MAMPPVKLSILSFPQEFIVDPAPAIIANVLLIPRYDPTKSLVPELVDIPTFAASDLILHAGLVQGNDQLPKLGDGTIVDLGLPGMNNRTAFFNTLQTKFSIDDSLPRLADKPTKGYTAATHIKKYLSQSYRQSFNYTQPRTPFAVTDDSYICAQRNAVPPTTYVEETTINWGKVFAFILRQPALAASLGLIFQQVTIPFPGADKDFLKDGGWLYFDFDAAGDLSVLEKNDVNINRYTARIPSLVDKRPLFAAVQFPISNTIVGSRNFDDAFVEAASYDDGFTKIVHASQAKSAELMGEDENPGAVTKDFGIRLGWDDEQITIWQNRQLQASDPTNTTVANTPMGVMSYRVDVGKFSELSAAAKLDPQPDNIPWHSLSRVHVDNLSTDNINLGEFNGELGVEVYPMQFARLEEGEFWLPAFFSTWHGNSLVVTDKDSFELNSHDKVVNNQKDKIPIGSNLNNFYQAVVDAGLDLKYGETYFFRVRLVDITGGGPLATDFPAYDSENPFATAPFRRYIAPRKVEFTNLPDAFTSPNALTTPYTQESFLINRPRLNYPALLFTGLDTANALTLLKNDKVAIETAQQSADPAVRRGAYRPFGFYDPDITAMGIRIEVKALEMDNLLSKSGRDSYILLYETTRNFSNTLDQPINLQLQYKDMPVLDVDTPAWIENAFHPVDDQGVLVLPTARAIRLTFYGIAKADDDLIYFGSQAARIGEEFSFIVRKDSQAEAFVFIKDQPVNQLKCIWLKPDPAPSVGEREILRLSGKPDQPDIGMMSRLASACKLQLTGDMTFAGQPGERIQFGCSQFIRHHLAPDNSSITFSTKADLSNHWITAIMLEVDRDWTWDELMVNSFSISRQQKFGREIDFSAPVDLGVLPMSKTASRLSLQNPLRKFTKIIFFDAVEPKPHKPGDFPDTLDLSYSIVTNFKNPALENPDNKEYVLSIECPVTTIPAQVPKIASAGIALSEYVARDNYSATDRRAKYFWMELEEPIEDPNDRFFIRVLSYAPDPLLAEFIPDLAVTQDEPPLAIDDEPIRIISIDQTEDESGLDAMQEMIPANTAVGEKPRHFIIPLPPGLFVDSRELFGFFTYELRVGHADIWCTAQGRWGHPLGITGAQHPAPQLLCNVIRDPNRIFMTARYAESVFEGKNLTPQPPRTDIWGLLYVQVLQADGKSYRNILIAQKRFNKPIRGKLADHQPDPLANIKRKAEPGKIKLKADAVLLEPIPIGSLEVQSPDMPPYGQTWWDIKNVYAMLRSWGLPADSPLSVLAVELMPPYDNQDFEHYSDQPPLNLGSLGGFSAVSQLPGTLAADKKLFEGKAFYQPPLPPPPDHFQNPLSTDLGKVRILRTSPLTPVPEVCAPV